MLFKITPNRLLLSGSTPRTCHRFFCNMLWRTCFRFFSV